jgi:flagellar basal body-associated protein FliL
MAEEEQVVEEKKGPNMMIIIGVVVALAGGGAFFMMGGKEKGPVVEVQEEVDVYPLKKELTITFKDENGDPHYLLLNISYLTKSIKTREMLIKKESSFRQKLNFYLLGLDGETITSKSGISKIRNKVFTILSGFISEGKFEGKFDTLDEVYIEKYIVQ